jgi:hypothetical protein
MGCGESSKERAEKTVESQIAAQVERAQVEAEGVAPIFRDIISKNVDIGKTTNENIASLSGIKAFQQASETLARADLDAGRAIARAEQSNLSEAKKLRLVEAAIKSFVDARGREIVAEIELQKKTEAAKKDGGPEKP